MNPSDLQNFNLYPNGFTMVFPNGLKASVRWGFGNYCVRNNPKDFSAAMTAEVAALDTLGDFVHVPGFDYQGDDVLPSLSPQQVLAFLNALATMDADAVLRSKRDSPTFATRLLGSEDK